MVLSLTAPSAWNDGETRIRPVMQVIVAHAISTDLKEGLCYFEASEVPRTRPGPFVPSASLVAAGTVVDGGPAVHVHNLLRSLSVRRKMPLLTCRPRKSLSRKRDVIS